MHLPIVYMEYMYSECLPTLLNPLAERTCCSQVEALAASVARLLPGFDPSLEPEDTLPPGVQAREAEFKALWGAVDMRNDRVVAATGVAFRPFDETLRDCVESLVAVGGVAPRLTPSLAAGLAARL